MRSDGDGGRGVAKAEGQERRCQGCGTRLARDNRSQLCSPCARREAQTSCAPIKPDSFWQATPLQQAFDVRHFGQVLYAYRYEHRPVLTQTKIGRWLGLSQGQVSRLERTEEPCHDLNKLDEWARTLHIPQRHLWFQLSQQPHDEYAGSGDAVMPIVSTERPGQEATRTCDDDTRYKHWQLARHPWAARPSPGSARDTQHRRPHAQWA